MSTQRLSIDLKKNAKLAELVADKEPGDSVFAELLIVSKDEQTVVVEIEACGETAKVLEDHDDDDDEYEKVADGNPPAKKPDAPGDDQ